jgi:hypothetical protein
MLIYPKELTIPLGDYVCIGCGFINYSNQLPETVKQKIYLDDGCTYPDARFLIELANEEVFAEVDISMLNLLYIREKVALDIYEQKVLRS